MVSKSANYCFTNKNNPTGILLLCEVALGESRELLRSDYHANNLPAGKSSTKGLGRTIPDPSHSTAIGDVYVPYGKPIQDTGDDLNQRSLLYNEYIVYDVSQIRIKYLIRTKFNHKW